MTRRATDFAGLLRRLLEAEVDFIVIGGVACNVHGSARATFDIDVVYARNAGNIDRVVGAPGSASGYLRSELHAHHVAR